VAPNRSHLHMCRLFSRCLGGEGEPTGVLSQTHSMHECMHSSSDYLIPYNNNNIFRVPRIDAYLGLSLWSVDLLNDSLVTGTDPGGWSEPGPL
jgi:hypothetical protein